MCRCRQSGSTNGVNFVAVNRFAHDFVAGLDAARKLGVLLFVPANLLGDLALHLVEVSGELLLRQFFVFPVRHRRFAYGLDGQAAEYPFRIACPMLIGLRSSTVYPYTSIYDLLPELRIQRRLPFVRLLGSNQLWSVDPSTSAYRHEQRFQPRKPSMIPKEGKRLAKVDFPMAAVLAHSAREKSVRSVIRSRGQLASAAAADGQPRRCRCTLPDRAARISHGRSRIMRRILPDFPAGLPCDPLPKCGVFTQRHSVHKEKGIKH